MKKSIYTFFIITCIPLFTFACDICGCGVGNNYIGILPEFRKQILGIRYRYNSLDTHVGVGGSSTYLTTKEHYHTAELWGGINLGKKFRVMVSIPYNFNDRINQGTTKTKNGLGDISLWGYYQLVNKKKTVLKNKLLVQNLWLGAGIKLPTGKYNPADKSAGASNTNLFQLGTGSVDFNVNAMYDIRLQDAGLNLTANYKINNANKDSYRYGNKYSVNVQPYYKFRIKNKLVVAPNVAMQYENARADKDKGFVVNVSGGTLLSGSVGLELAFKRMALGGNFQIPIHQNLALGTVMANNRAMFHVAYAW